jgi:hypothetical protein
MKDFHRIFICRLCGRICGGCRCKEAVPEYTDACAVCASVKRKAE